jgi:CheY-like chemotaxis protein
MPSAKAQRTVLVVEDDASLRNSVRLILEHKGYDVTLARDGVVALEKARATAFDVILMDIRMPGMSGVEVFEAIRAESLGPAVVFITAYAMNDVESRLLEEGVVDVLRKPVDVDRLLNLLDGLFRTTHEGWA